MLMDSWVFTFFFYFATVCLHFPPALRPVSSARWDLNLSLLFLLGLTEPTMINLTLRVSVFPSSCSLCLLVNVFPFCALCYHLLAISIAHFNVLYVFCVCMCVCVCARLISCWRLLISCEVLPSFSWLMVDSVMALKTQTPRHRGSNAQIKGELWIWDFILFFTLHLKTYRLFSPFTLSW